MSDLSYYAAFDTLWVLSQRGEADSGRLSEGAITTIALFACITSLSDKWVPADWGYQFLFTRDIGISSVAIPEAIQMLQGAQYIDSDNNQAYRATVSGSAYVERLKTQFVFRDRIIFLSAASYVASIVGPNLVRNAIDFEPTAFTARMAERPDLLLDGAASAVLLEQLRILTDIVGDSYDPYAVSGSYFEYLQQQSLLPA
jgi:hypothetical protein